MSREQVVVNIAGVKKQVTQLFSGEKYLMVDNYDWLNDLKYLDILRDVGKHFSMTELMQRDFVTERMGKDGAGISYAEFSYSIVQGYDYWHLYKHHQVVMQIGGSDQWGNLLSGVSLIRKREAAEVHALSMPLVVNKLTGVKFGKSEGGAIWLDPQKTTPTQFYQFWINTDDADVEDYLKIYTLLSKPEVEKIVEKHASEPGHRFGQSRLAEEVTRLVHGEEAMRSAQTVTNVLVGGTSIGDAKTATIEELRREIPAAKTKNPEDSIVEALVGTGLATSNTEAKRLLVENAISINGQKVNRDKFEAPDFQNGRLLLRRGKAFKDSALVELE